MRKSGKAAAAELAELDNIAVVEGGEVMAGDEDAGLGVVDRDCAEDALSIVPILDRLRVPHQSIPWRYTLSRH